MHRVLLQNVLLELNAIKTDCFCLKYATFNQQRFSQKLGVNNIHIKIH